MKVIDRKHSPIDRKITGIKSGRIEVWLGDSNPKSNDVLGINVKELPPFTNFPDRKKNTYKFLGFTKTMRGETIEKFSVRNKKHHNDKHLTLKYNVRTEIKDIEDIEDEEKYKLVTTYLRLPKSAIRNLRDEFNEFLSPSLSKTGPPAELFEVLKQPYALHLIKHFSEHEELTVEEFRKITKLGTHKPYKCLKEFEKLGLLRSYKYGKSSTKIYQITIEKAKIAKIMAVLID